VVRVLVSALVFALLAAACSSAPATKNAPPTSVTPTSGATAPGSGAPTPGTTAAASAPAARGLLTIPLTDVRTSLPFTLGGFAGKTVIVEGMAVW
jgi:hypothetical protein